MGLDIEKVKTLRTKKGLSLEQAAIAAGFKDRQAWHRIESGASANVTLETLENIAKALGVSAKSLIK
jgi:transcriptional regulator with XRE-family HTH domain